MSVFLRVIWIAAAITALSACDDSKQEPSSQPNQEIDERFLDEGEPDTPSEGF